MGNSTVKSMGRSDPTVFSSKQLEKNLKRDIINPITKYTADIATIPIKGVKASISPLFKGIKAMTTKKKVKGMK